MRKVMWFYDCDLGQGVVMATTKDAATREATLDAGRYAEVHNVHRPTAYEIDFRRTMGGNIPGKK